MKGVSTGNCYYVVSFSLIILPRRLDVIAVVCNGIENGLYGVLNPHMHNLVSAYRGKAMYDYV